MKISNLTVARYGLLGLAIALLLLGSALSSCSQKDSSLDSYTIPSPTEEFKELKWPTDGLAQMLPKPESTYGKISTESSTLFYAYIGDTSLDQYDAYVNACKAQGFTVDYSKSESHFDAENESGYDLSLRYEEDESYMTVRLSAPQSSSASSSASTSAPASSSAAAEQPAPTAEAADAPVNGIRPSFKEAVDSYEAFFDEYCAFMEKYNANPDSPTLIAEYARFMSQYADTMSKLSGLESESLSSEESQYLADALARINQQLAETGTAL